MNAHLVIEAGASIPVSILTEVIRVNVEVDILWREIGCRAEILMNARQCSVTISAPTSLEAIGVSAEMGSTLRLMRYPAMVQASSTNSTKNNCIDC